MTRLGGRPHWGKMHTRDAAYLATVYPRFADFQALRDRLDPRPAFSPTTIWTPSWADSGRPFPESTASCNLSVKGGAKAPLKSDASACPVVPVTPVTGRFGRHPRRSTPRESAGDDLLPPSRPAATVRRHGW